MHLICGEALYDVFVDDCEGSGVELLLKAVVGGSPLNVAIGMARLGASVGLASDLARDSLGNRIVAHLAKEQVAATFLRRTAAATALAVIITDDEGKPSYSFSGLDQAIYCPATEAVEQADAMITGLHLGSIAIVLPSSARPLLDLARRFADRALISLDPNIRLSIVSDVVIWRRAIDDLRAFCHVVKVSEEDIAVLYGDADPETLCQGWLSDRTALVVLTRGSAGASLFTRAVGRVQIPAADTAVVDTVGAGDSFMAALLSMLTRKTWVSSATLAALTAGQLFALGRYAALAAGVTCSRRGPTLPTTLELDALDATSIETVV